MTSKCLLNGEFVEDDQLHISPSDAGFVLGATVTEQLRTFRGQLFRLAEHLQRLGNSLNVVGIGLEWSLDQLAGFAQELVGINRAAIDDGDDLGLCIFATPGPFATLAGTQPVKPMLAMHTYPLPFGLWHSHYAMGSRLIVSRHRQVSRDNWPLDLKCRSRMHYYLADQEVRRHDPDAKALLLDADGRVSETSTANVLAYFEREGLLSPPDADILPGISLGYVRELADAREIPFRQRRLDPEELASADEVWLTSTPYCLLPVCRLNDRPIAGGKPGPMFRIMLDAWGQEVGIDISSQAIQFAERRPENT